MYVEGAMRDGRSEQITILFVETVSVDLVDQRRLPRTIRLHHAFRRSGGPAGELDRLNRIRACRDTVRQHTVSLILKQEVTALAEALARSG
jgi:hypothetical protein